MIMKQNLQRPAVALALSIGTAAAGTLATGLSATPAAAKCSGLEVVGHCIRPPSPSEQAGAIGGIFTGKSKVSLSPCGTPCKFDDSGTTKDLHNTKYVNKRKNGIDYRNKRSYTRPSAGLQSPAVKPKGYTRASAGLPAPGGLKPKPNPTGPIVPEKSPNWGHGKPGDFDNGKRPGRHGHHHHRDKGKHRS
jgi:hypothetical protein